MDVIITRPAIDAAPFADLVSQAGGNPVMSPVMAIRFIDAPVDLAGVGALAFTSASGVRAFVRRNAARDIKVFAVGEATAAAARCAGFSLVEAAGGDVEKLAGLVGDQPPAGQVLHIAGSDRAGELADLLNAQGIEAGRAVLYQAEPISCLSDCAAKALRRGDAVVTFFSPRTARLFLEQARRAGLTSELTSATALCLSSAVAAAAAECDWKAGIVASTRSAAGMAAAAGELARSRKSRGV